MKLHQWFSSSGQCVQSAASPVTRLRHFRSSTGFTLIELLVVFSLMALLLSIAVPRYLNAVDAAREKVRQQNMATMRDALDKFRADQGRYPNELSELVGKLYLRQIPLDPVSKSTAWTVLPHPAGLEPGVYDVAPPSAMDTSVSDLSSSAAVPGDSPALPQAPASAGNDSVVALPASP